MPLVVNLRHLEEHDVILRGELPVDELDLDTRDEMIRVTRPLQHEIEVQMLDDSLLLRGSLRTALWIAACGVRIGRARLRRANAVFAAHGAPSRVVVT